MIKKQLLTKVLTLLLLLGSGVGQAWAQYIAWEDMATAGHNATKEPTATTAHITANAGEVVGLSANGTKDIVVDNVSSKLYRYNGFSALVDNSKYFQYTLTPDANYVFQPTQIVIGWAPSGGKAVGFDVYVGDSETNLTKVKTLTHSSDLLYEENYIAYTSPFTIIRLVPYGKDGQSIILNKVVLIGEAKSAIGTSDKDTGWYINDGENAYSNAYTLVNFHEYTFEFDCIQGNEHNAWNSWVVTGCKTSADFKDPLFVVRPDDWVFDKDTNTDGIISGSDGAQHNPALAPADGSFLNWDQYRQDINGAHVKIKVSYDMNTHRVFVYQIITSADGSHTYTYYYPYTDSASALGDKINLYVGVDKSQLINFTASEVQGYKVQTQVVPENSGRVVMTNDEGTAILEGSIVGQGTRVNISAVANNGYTFTNWSEGATASAISVYAGDNVYKHGTNYTHTFDANFKSAVDYVTTWALTNNSKNTVYSAGGETWYTSGNWMQSRLAEGEEFTGAYRNNNGTGELASFAGLLFNGNVAITNYNSDHVKLYKNGGVMKVPVLAGEVLQFNAKTGSGNRDLIVTNTDGSTINCSITNGEERTFHVIAARDGYIILSNNTDQEHQIRLLSKTLIHEFAFADGDNVAATPGTAGYINEIVRTSGYPLLDGAEYIWTSSNPENVKVDQYTGAVTVNSNFSSDVTITATRQAIGNYPAVSKSYTLTALQGNALTHKNQEKHAKVLLNESGTAVYDVDAFWTNPEDSQIKDKDIKYTVIYTSAKNAFSTPDEDGFGTSEIAIEGKGTTAVVASCGAISCTFYIDTYGFVFDAATAVYDFPESNTYAQSVEGASSYAMEKIGAISTKSDCVISSEGVISGLPSYDDNKGGAIVVKTTGWPEVTETYIENSSFDQDKSNWTINISNNLADGYQAASYSNGSIIINKFIETWRPSETPLADGEIFQTLSSLPAGNYTLNVDAVAVNQGTGPATNVYLFAQEGTGEWQKINVSTSNAAPQNFSLNFTKTNNNTTLTIGIATRSGDGTVNANWIAADNFTLLQEKEASYVLTIPYKKYTWNFYNEGETSAITAAQVLKEYDLTIDGQAIKGYHLTMGDLVPNGNPHAASEVPADGVEIPNNGSGRYPGQYISNYDDGGLVGHVKRELRWQKEQNDSPNANNTVTNNLAHKYWNYTFKTREHYSRISTNPVSYCNEPLFSYRYAVNGNNVRIVEDTQGLIFNAGANAFGINDSYYYGGPVTVNGLTYQPTAWREMDRSILIYKGASFTIPFVKQGDYVKLHWYRHSTNAGDQFSVTNAVDMDDIDINPDHVLRITGSQYQGRTDGTYVGYTIVRAKQDGPITFTAKANSWIEIYTVELTDEYKTELRVICAPVYANNDADWGGPTTSVLDGKNMDDNIISIVRDSRSTGDLSAEELATSGFMDSKKTTSSNELATMASNQFGSNPIIYIASYPGATNGWNGWNLNVQVAPVNEDDSKLSIGTVKDLYSRIGNSTVYRVTALTNFHGTGTARVTVRTMSGSVNGSTSHALDKQEAYFPVGEYRPQKYPYTWDFTQYNINGTKTGDTNGIQHRNMSSARTTSYGGWNADNKLTTYAPVDATVQPERNHKKYNKFIFADGAELTMNQSSDEGATYIREAEGLRVDLADEMNSKNDYRNENAVTMDGNVLNVTGSITVPEVDQNMYIFVRSTNKPTSVVGAVDMNGTDKLASVNVSYSTFDNNVEVALNNGDIPANVWIYKQTNEDKTDVVITPNGAIEAIGVTDYMKPMVQFKNMPRATYTTDARAERIDYHNTGIFTNHDLQAYVANSNAVMASTDSNSKDSENGTISLTPISVVPAQGAALDGNRGIMLEDVVAGTTNTARPLLPLFVPACNLPDESLVNNKLIGCIGEESVPASSSSAMIYTLTNQYYDWDWANKKAAENPEHHVASDASFYINRTAITSRKNSAYLSVPVSSGAKQIYMIIGEDDMDEPTAIEGIEFNSSDDIISEPVEVYTLTGVKLSGMPTQKGVYVINGKKVFVK